MRGERARGASEGDASHLHPFSISDRGLVLSEHNPVFRARFKQPRSNPLAQVPAGSPQDGSAGDQDPRLFQQRRIQVEVKRDEVNRQENQTERSQNGVPL